MLIAPMPSADAPLVAMPLKLVTLVAPPLFPEPPEPPKS